MCVRGFVHIFLLFNGETFPYFWCCKRSIQVSVHGCNNASGYHLSPSPKTVHHLDPQRVLSKSLFFAPFPPSALLSAMSAFSALCLSPFFMLVCLFDWSVFYTECDRYFPPIILFVLYGTTLYHSLCYCTVCVDVCIFVAILFRKIFQQFRARK